MNREEFLSYISHPENLGQGSLDSLQEIVAEYSYFQTAHLLLLKNLHNLGSIRFSNQLKYSSVFAGDRRLLYHLLHGNGRFDTTAEETPSGAFPETSGAEVEQTAVKEEGKVIEADELTGVVEQRLSEIEKEKSEEEGAGSAAQAVPAQQEGSEESLADRILREVAEAKKRKQEEGSGTGDEPGLPSEAMNAEGEEPSMGEETFILDGNVDNLPENGMDDQSPAPETKLSDSLLEIDEEEGLEAPRQEKKNSHLRSSEPGRTEKKTPGLSGARTIETSESHTFSQWIELLSMPGSSPAEDRRGKDQGDLIDKFIRENPRISPGKTLAEEENPDISEKSVQETESLFTDTLARIYVKQGYYSKAIFAYEKLSLKFPEKSSYFATQIEKIRELINIKSKQ